VGAHPAAAKPRTAVPLGFSAPPAPGAPKTDQQMLDERARLGDPATINGTGTKVAQRDTASEISATTAFEIARRPPSPLAEVDPLDVFTKQVKQRLLSRKAGISGGRGMAGLFGGF